MPPSPPSRATPPAVAPGGRPGRTTCWVLLAGWAFFTLTASGRLHTVDEYEAFYMTESLVERGTLSLPPEKAFFGRWDGSPGGAARSGDPRGRFWAPYGPLPAVAAAPFYAAGRAVADACGLDGRVRESFLWFATSLLNPLVAALGLAAFHFLARRLGAAPGPALGATFLFGLGTPWWHYATTFFSEPLAGLLLIGASVALVPWLRGAGDAEGAKRRLLAGLPLGLLVLVRLSHAVLLPVVAALVLLGEGPDRDRVPLVRRAGRAAVVLAPAVLAVAGYALWNTARFGDPLQPGYPDTVDGQPREAFFATPFLTGLWGLLASPGKGLVLFAPPAAAGLLLAPRLVRRAGPPALALLALPAAALLVFATYRYWEGGYCWGPRFLVPTLAVWVLPLALARPGSGKARAAVVALALAAVPVQALGVSVSFLECQVDTGYYTAGKRYDLDYAALPATAGVFATHLGDALEGRLLEGPEGLGFDRWFLQLRKAGLPAGPLTAAAAALAAACIAATVLLVRSVLREARSAREPAEPPEVETERAHQAVP